jgi:hypothetical protein
VEFCYFGSYFLSWSIDIVSGINSISPVLHDVTIISYGRKYTLRPHSLKIACILRISYIASISYRKSSLALTITGLRLYDWYPANRVASFYFYCTDFQLSRKGTPPSSHPSRGCRSSLLISCHSSGEEMWLFFFLSENLSSESYTCCASETLWYCDCVRSSGLKCCFMRDILYSSSRHSRWLAESSC